MPSLRLCLSPWTLDGGVEWRGASVEITPRSIMILEVDHMGLVWVFCNVGEVEVYGLTKRPKIDLALMLENKVGVLAA